MNLFAFLMISSLIAFSNASSRSHAAASLHVSKNDIVLRLGDNTTFTASLSGWVGRDPIKVGLDYEDTVIKVEPESVLMNSSSEFTMVTKGVGHAIVLLNASDPSVSTSWAFIRVNVYHLELLVWVSTIVGWLYFAAWSVSFYPQTYSNFKRKSVVGLNFDFLALNLSGFLSYSIYNLCFYYSSTIQDEYHDLNPTGVVPVELNDVVFAVHALVATAIQIIQCFIYDRGGQTMSLLAIGFLTLGWVGSVVFLGVTLGGLNTSWLTFLYYFSNFKLVITIIKYIPQAVYNYRRKSTTGWSIGNILLDLTGGSLSILQMFIIAYNFSDWTPFSGNYAKTALGFFSICFDFLFMFQHYILYRHKSQNYENFEEPTPA